MLGRNLLFVAIIGLGAVLPYLLSNDEWMSSAGGWWQTIQTKVGGQSPENEDGHNENDANLIGKLPPEPSTAPGLTNSANNSAYPPLATRPAAYGGIGNSGRELKLPTIVGPPGASLEQLLRFDATTEWIAANWARVSTRVASLELDGWRVSVTTGSQPQDLAGSITYLFDERRDVQRITLHGYVGDKSAILALAAQRFQMQRVASRKDDLFVATIADQTLGALRVASAPMIRAGAPQGRYEILMELNRIGTRFGISPEFRRILQQAQTPTPAEPIAPSGGASKT